jgi:hypothetical protein
MGYEVAWFEPNRVICMTARDNLTIDELGAAIKFIEDGVRSGTGTVHLIVDAREIRAIPSNVLEIKKRITYLDRDKMGWIVLVGMNPLISTFIKVLTSLLGTKFNNFKSLRPALEFIATHDESLKDLAERAIE